MVAEKKIQCLSTTMFIAKKRCHIYGHKPVLCYGFYGSHLYCKPYHTQAVQSLDGMGMVLYIQCLYPPYVWWQWASLHITQVLNLLVTQVRVTWVTSRWQAGSWRRQVLTQVLAYNLPNSSASKVTSTAPLWPLANISDSYYHLISLQTQFRILCQWFLLYFSPVFLMSRRV